jgi:hypothetical protein
MLTMVRKRKPGSGRTPGPNPRMQNIVQFKGSPEFKAWFDELVQHCSQSAGWPYLPAAVVVERALYCLAKQLGYEKPPPKR